MPSSVVRSSLLHICHPCSTRSRLDPPFHRNPPTLAHPPLFETVPELAEGLLALPSPDPNRGACRRRLNLSSDTQTSQINYLDYEHAALEILEVYFNLTVISCLTFLIGLNTPVHSFVAIYQTNKSG